MDYHSSKLYGIVIRLLEILGINPSKMKEFIKFGAVGGLGVLVNMGFFFIFTLQSNPLNIFCYFNITCIFLLLANAIVQL